jgi:hypothetical protein
MSAVATTPGRDRVAVVGAGLAYHLARPVGELGSSESLDGARVEGLMPFRPDRHS